jgi:hypothetical protein
MGEERQEQEVSRYRVRRAQHGVQHYVVGKYREEVNRAEHDGISRRRQHSPTDQRRNQQSIQKEFRRRGNRTPRCDMVSGNGAASSSVVVERITTQSVDQRVQQPVPATHRKQDCFSSVEPASKQFFWDAGTTKR